MDALLQITRNIGGDFRSPGAQFFWGWILLYVIVGFFLSRRRQEAFSFRQGLTYSFPKKTFWGSSARLDYALILVDHSVQVFVPALAITPRISHVLGRLGSIHIPISNGFWVDLVYTVLLLVVTDLGITIQHLLFHRVPYLWQFHKVHHSATGLNIFTIQRLHPVETLSQGGASAVTVGIFVGACHFLLGYTPDTVLFLKASIAWTLFRIVGIYRHSHIWISFGPIFSYVFSSPAMHQIHHSIELKHHDKNFSTVFSFWDGLFGTLYIPKEQETLEYGISAEEKGDRDYNSLFGSVIHPFLPNKLLTLLSLGPTPEKRSAVSGITAIESQRRKIS